MKKEIMKRAPLIAGFTDNGDIPLTDIPVKEFNRILFNMVVAVMSDEPMDPNMNYPDINYEFRKSKISVDDVHYTYSVYIHILTAPIERIVVIGNNLHDMKNACETIVHYKSKMMHCGDPVYYSIIGVWYKTTDEPQPTSLIETFIVTELNQLTLHAYDNSASVSAPFEMLKFSIKAPWMQLTIYDDSFRGNSIPHNPENNFAVVMCNFIRNWTSPNTSCAVFYYNSVGKELIRLDGVHELFQYSSIQVLSVATLRYKESSAFRYYLCNTPDDVLAAVELDRSHGMPKRDISLWGYWIFVPASIK